jgi:hypothetical protein
MGNIFQDMGRDTHAQKYFRLAESTARESSETAAAAAYAADLAGGGGRAASALSALPAFAMQLGEKRMVDIDGVVMDIECESERPLIIRVRNFALPEECEHIIARAEPRLEKSYLIGTNGVAQVEVEGSAATQPGSGGGAGGGGGYRDSKNTWLSVDQVLARLQARISAVTGLPIAYVKQVSEELQVVKYDTAGSTFRVHHDSSTFQPRLLTALVYLADVDEEEGEVSAGETWFPFTGEKNRNFDNEVESIDKAIIRAQNLEESIKAGVLIEQSEAEGKQLRVRPVRGDAVLFFNHLPSGALDSAAVHAGLPTPHGAVKWIANYWIQLDVKQLNAQQST